MNDSQRKTANNPISETRRKIVQLGALMMSGMSALLGGCSALLKNDNHSATEKTSSVSATLQASELESSKFDYVVIGSGAGGGPLACRLAINGFRVLLLEAGGDDEPCEYQVPALHPFASESESIRWDYFVKHYSDNDQQLKDSKYVREKNGVLYPRSGTLGGCTAHNAMILVYPHNSDWDKIARLMNDHSWNSENMHQYFQRIEKCEYANIPISQALSRHGYKGWLPTNVADIKLLLADTVLFKLLLATVTEWTKSTKHDALALIKRILFKDPNDWRFISNKARQNREGLSILPVTTKNGKRTGTREYIKSVQKQYPNNLEVRTHALAQRILLDENNVAYGVEYLSGRHLYRADPNHEKANDYKTETVLVNREVIVSAGAFNTPQLLKLSGIGPKEELQKHNIPLKSELPGVGENLQDRYEVSVVTQLTKDIPLVKGIDYRCSDTEVVTDKKFQQWQNYKIGPYATNGATVSLTRRSRPDLEAPDLFIFGMIGDFRGYYPGYANHVLTQKNLFTWAVLKGHTQNKAGTVQLRSNDPRDTPEINFNYFYGNDAKAQEDLDSVAFGVATVRKIIKNYRELLDKEIYPGEKVADHDDIQQFIKDQAWGHHASCTCKMGPRSDKMAVVDSKFRVYGTQNLRVVDASIFPEIPGLFIVSAIYMISEKASDVILEDARLNSL